MRGRRGLDLIQRPRLQERLAAAPIVVLEAPGGYGKSTAWSQLAAALDVATVRVVLRGPTDITRLLSSVALGCRRAGLVTLAEAIDVEGPSTSIDRLTDRIGGSSRRVLLAVDEVHRAAPEAAAWLAGFAGQLPERARLVIAGRRVGPAVAALSEADGAAFFGVPELRFDEEEVAAFLAAARNETPDRAEARAVLAATEGWPAAVVLAATRRSDSGGRMPSAGTSPAGVLSGLVDGLLSAAGPTARELVAAIADLPLLSAEVLGALGGEGTLDRLLDAGLPIRFRPDGWGELPDPVRELFPALRLPPAQTRAVARIYAQHGELAEGAALLHRAGDPEGLVALLAAQRREALGRAGLAFFDAVLSGVPDEALAGQPSALVKLVQAAEHQPRLRSAWTERALRLLPDGSPARRAVEAERALDQARAGDLEGATRTADRILATAADDEIVTRGRSHLARALCLLLRDTAGSTTEVAAELELAIGLFSLAGERSWEAEGHQALGYGVHFTTGAFELAAERLERALALRAAPDAARAGTLTFVAEVLTHVGRLDDATVALREATSIGHRLGDGRTIAFAAWSAAELHCQRRDRAAAVAALEEAEAHPEGWFDRLAGIDFLSHAAEIRTILGDQEGAKRDLTRAEARAVGTARAERPLWARARLEATHGDPSTAIRHLDALDRSPIAYRADRWLRLLLRAVCAERLGDRAGAVALAQRSEQAAVDLGDPDRAARREPELLTLLTPGEEPSPPTSVSVVLLGRFAVERNGVDVSPPPGRPATLVKLLAVQGSVTTEEAIDLLWPEADLDTGRARLRNLLNRIRAVSGELVGRRDQTLSLAPRTSVDAHRFEEDAAAALAARPEARAGLARRALARSTGELLPADRYADWATVPRERLRRRHLALLDLVAEDAIARGDLDEADRLLDAAISTDPLEELRYVRLARALLGQGRIRQARRVLDQGVAVANELGVEPGDELRALLTELGEHA